MDIISWLSDFFRDRTGDVESGSLATLVRNGAIVPKHCRKPTPAGSAKLIDGRVVEPWWQERPTEVVVTRKPKAFIVLEVIEPPKVYRGSRRLKRLFASKPVFAKAVK
jgi:hypothetical protein